MSKYFSFALPFYFVGKIISKQSKTKKELRHKKGQN
jgi:hypothetical protein